MAANPDIEISPSVYLTQVPDFTGFNDPVRGKEAALALYNQGADVIYHAAGGSGLGLFQAADELSTDDNFLWAIGVDADQYNTVGEPALQEHILTSMLKRVDVAVGATILEFLEDGWTPGAQTFDLAVEGVGVLDHGWLHRRHHSRSGRFQGPDHRWDHHRPHHARGLGPPATANLRRAQALWARRSLLDWERCQRHPRFSSLV